MARTKSWDYDQNVVFNLGTDKQPELYRININTKGNNLEQEDFSTLETKLKKACASFDFGDKLKLTTSAPYDPGAGIDTDW